LQRTAVNGKRQYRLTPASLAQARSAGMTLPVLETWFQQRTGQTVSAAARLLLTGAQVGPPSLRRHLVLHVEAAEIADGLMQWPVTRELIAERLGPTALAVADEDAAELRKRLAELGVAVKQEGE
jgi:hypothetical protein